MKFLRFFSTGCLLSGVSAFVSGPAARHQQLSSSLTSLQMKNNFDADNYAKSMSAAAIEQMKNLKPEDLDKMIAEIDNMGGMQKAALKAMNMDVS
jgi:hypothetical protein